MLPAQPEGVPCTRAARGPPADGRALSPQVEATPHAQLHLTWAKHLMMEHGGWLAENRAKVAAPLKGLHRALSRQYSDVGGLANANGHTIAFVTTMGRGGEEVGGEEEGEEGE